MLQICVADHRSEHHGVIPHPVMMDMVFIVCRRRYYSPRTKDGYKYCTRQLIYFHTRGFLWLTESLASQTIGRGDAPSGHWGARWYWARGV